MSTIAHVGHTKTPADFERMMRSHEAGLGIGVDIIGMKPDFIDLRNGRDFLAEHKQYDVVILHLLFRGGFGISADKVAEHFKSKTIKAQLAISPLQGWGAWIRRLTEANPQVIFTFGNGSEVSGSYIAILEGYQSKQLADDFWMFRKTPSQAENSAKYP